MNSKILIIGLVAHTAMTLMSATARYKVMVLDAETDKPVANAKVFAGFVMGSRGWDNTPPANMDEALTDKNGLCSLSGTTDEGEAYHWAEKEGYYKAEYGEVKFQKASFLLGWKPDNIVATMRIDRIEKPIPLFVKGVYGVVCDWWNPKDAGKSDYKDIVSTNRMEFGFDLLKGEWMPPYGKGENTDLMISCQKESLGITKHRKYHGGFMTVERYRVDADIRVVGDDNGICLIKRHPHALVKVRTAPEDGYGIKNIHRVTGMDEHENPNLTNYYAFRIRTVKDQRGKIVSAYYGKVYYDFWVNGASGVAFQYFLNPSQNDRNLEWDMENNLCPVHGRIYGLRRP